jgi:L-cysteine:1D-myo-inositol 2-amino-2-deoxy-alpha-D-glucopyranoside ligase
VECAAIASEYLGIVFDVQAGGSDLVFPHHEMSASHARVAFAQSEDVFARIYAHAGMVSYQGAKMSKSLGNLVFVNRLLADGIDPMAIRLALLAHHYRADWEWTDDVLAEANVRLDRWRAAAGVAGTSGDAGARGAAAGGESVADGVLTGVRAALADDLDAPAALAVIDRWADAVLAAGAGSGSGLVRRTADALLGVSL